ncbi:hypothetical protein EN804_36765 [Mesorhizobium sp. M8A.F.Ca.ET.161.01.1.1]|nr:hypothetical protein EN804_36765 [Mesorhizobium sp. M8A.F.Ca.ET.161.01.1.1]
MKPGVRVTETSLKELSEIRRAFLAKPGPESKEENTFRRSTFGRALGKSGVCRNFFPPMRFVYF